MNAQDQHQLQRMELATQARSVQVKEEALMVHVQLVLECAV